MKFKFNFQWIAIVLIAIFSIFNYFDKPSYVSFDIKSVTNEFITKVKNNNSGDVEKQVNAFNMALVESLADYERSHNAVIFVNGAVVTETKDITPEIRVSVRKAMVEFE